MRDTPTRSGSRWEPTPQAPNDHRPVPEPPCAVPVDDQGPFDTAPGDRQVPPPGADGDGFGTPGKGGAFDDGSDGSPT